MSRCKLCGAPSSSVVQMFKDQQVEHNGQMLTVRTEASLCGWCGRSFVSTEQSKRNDIAIQAAKEQADSLQ